ncbi:MAG: tRNA dihydrouridine(20/20a) synthase DusA [Neisseriales bacterium]|nr:MAG: tRNA dihydrouridine(20/20a) synthase DusA [Neisseriales bacterium]
MLSPNSPWRICIAPMLNWTDRHYRYLMRQITRHTRLYTEMVTANALYFGQADKHLTFDPIEMPLALQIAGDEPKKLAYCAQLAQKWGYAEVNLNVGCPALRAQQGNFGACLMHQVNRVKEGIDAMRQASDIELSIKHRIGLDNATDYDFLTHFVGTLYEAGCQTFIVHARVALLNASPKKNRQVPPLQYDWVYRLKQDYPSATIVINGGIQTIEAMYQHLNHVDGVMIGRKAYREPYFFALIDQAFFGKEATPPDRLSLVQIMSNYIRREIPNPSIALIRTITRHMLHLYQGEPGAKYWRWQLSNLDKSICQDPNWLDQIAQGIDHHKASS